jgi:flagellar hook protein FlgE
MPFNIALSGIRAANNDLRVTGNNIANASTTGFKESRAEFGDIYSTAAIGVGLSQTGSGVRVQDVSQQFSQGNISFTENALDLSISGSGFFVTSFNGSQNYTRAGTFGLDQEGFIVNNGNARLQGFGADSSGNISGLIGDIQIQSSNIQPSATTDVDIALNVDSREGVIQTSGTSYVSSGGVATANGNGYTAQSLDFTNPSGTTATFTSALNENTFDTVSDLNRLAGITATATATASLSAWTSGLNVTINGASITNTGISQATATEINDLPGLTATYDAGSSTIAIESTIGDLIFEAAGSGGADQILTVAGATGAAQTIEYDGAGDLVTSGNLGVSGTFTAGTAVLPLGLATAGAGANDYDFSITVDGVDSAADISLPVADYASYAAMASALETAINADTNISGVSVDYDTDHFVFTSSTTGDTSTVALTAVGGSAADLGIGTGTATAGVNNITVGGIISLELDQNYSLTDNSGTPLFDNPSTTFVNNAFDPGLPETYNHSTSVTVYDSLGNPHVMQQYFIKQPYDVNDPTTTANHWQMAVQIDGENIGDPVISAPNVATLATYDLFFTQNGTLNESLSDDLLVSNWTPIDADGNVLGALGPLNVASGGSIPVATPALSSNFSITMTDSTQVGSDFEVRSLDQNGSTTGRLVGVEVDDTGIIFARYTNGENQILGQVALADFPNAQGLQSLGDTSWAETFDSGEPVIGGPGTASLGLIQSGALEDSNVDLSEQLVNLIIAQRNYQASAKTIETADQVTQTIINLR